MIYALTADDVTLQRESLVHHRRYLSGISDFHSRFMHSATHARALVAVGERLRQVDELDARLRQLLCELTGAPDIQHGNADIADSSAPAWPMTREDEAREANSRG